MVKLDNESLSIVIPVYNEERTLATVIANVLQLPQVLEVIAVDDCSSDATPAILERLAREHPQLRWSRHERNLGKTAALRTALAMSTGEIVVIQDADLEYDPAEIPDLIDPIVRGKADVVFGSRFLVRKAARVIYFYHYLANKLFTFCSNLLTNLNMTDVGTGYKAFRGEILRNMLLGSSGFGFDMEVTAKIAKLRCRVYEVPISYYGRTYEEGKKITTVDGIYALWYIFKYNLLVGLSRSYKTIPDLLSREDWVGMNTHGDMGHRSPQAIKGVLRSKVSKVGG
jgi:glycosyltransferase involved in cell wall biosynthesis